MRDREVRYNELRKDKNYKQKDIANVLQVKGDRYSKYERCINDMTLDKCNILANFYNVNFDYLLGISDNIHITPRNTISLNLLCDRLLQLRKEKKLSQSQLSKSLGFVQTTYSDYESGKYVPTVFKIYDIALFYNVSIDYLVGKTDDKKIY